MNACFQQRQISTNFSIELSASGTIWENPIQPQFHLLEENLNLTTNRIPIPSDVVNFGIANATATGMNILPNHILAIVLDFFSTVQYLALALNNPNGWCCNLYSSLLRNLSTLEEVNFLVCGR